MEGYVVKRGHFISNWKSRWLVVSGGEISYYVDHSKTQLKKKVTLDSKCTAERMPPLAKQKFVFLVSFPNKWDLIVSVESDELRQKWIDYIRTEILMLYGGPPPEPPQNARAPSTAKQPQKPMTLARAKATKRPTSVDGPSGAALAAAMAAASASAGASAAAPPASPTSGSAAANGKVSPSQQQQQQDQEPLPPGWAQATTEDGQMYYYHSTSRETRWDRPTASTSSQSRPSKETDDEDMKEYYRQYEDGRNTVVEDDEIGAERMIEECVSTWSKNADSGKTLSLPVLLNNLATILPSEVILAIHSSSHSAVLTVLEDIDKRTPPSEVKKIYQKIIRFIHPDKLPSVLDQESVYLVRHVFMVLNEQYDVYRQEHGLG